MSVLCCWDRVEPSYFGAGKLMSVVCCWDRVRRGYFGAGKLMSVVCCWHRVGPDYFGAGKLMTVVCCWDRVRRGYFGAGKLMSVVCCWHRIGPGYFGVGKLMSVVCCWQRLGPGYFGAGKFWEDWLNKTWTPCLLMNLASIYIIWKLITGSNLTKHLNKCYSLMENCYLEMVLKNSVLKRDFNFPAKYVKANYAKYFQNSCFRRYSICL